MPARPAKARIVSPYRFFQVELGLPLHRSRQPFRLIKPVQIVHCPVGKGGGHDYPRLDPRWFSDTNPHLGSDNLKYCPQHSGWTRDRRRRTATRRARIKAWDRYYDQIATPTHRRCPSCKQTRLIETDFYTRKRKRANGKIIEVPAPECKYCARVRAQAVRDSKTDEQKREDRKRWYASRDKEEVRRYNREYGRLCREAAGVTMRGPWRKYRQELESKNHGKVPRMPAPPFLEWLDYTLQQQQMSIEQLCRLAGVDSARIRSARRSGKIGIHTVDKFVNVFGRPDLLARLNTGRQHEVSGHE